MAEQFQRLSRTFRDVATEIGIRLLPVLTDVADWAEKNAPKIVKAFEQFPQILARALQAMELFLAAIAEALRTIPFVGEKFAKAFGMAAGEIGRAAYQLSKFKLTVGDTKDAVVTFAAGVRISLKDAFDSLNNFGNLAKEITTGAIRGLQGGMETLFTTLITRSQSAKEAFRTFAVSILTMLAQMIAKLIATIILMQLLKMIPGVGPAIAAAQSVGSVIKVGMPTEVKRHAGGLIPAYHSGGEVNALLEPGEFVVNRRSTAKNLAALQRMNNGGEGQGGVQNIFIVNATDAASFEGRLQGSAHVIEAIFQRAMRRNSGSMREAIRI